MVAGAFAVREDMHGGGRVGGTNGVTEASCKRKCKRFHDIRVAALYNVPVHDANGNRTMTEKTIARRLKEHRTEGLTSLRLRGVEARNACSKLRVGAVREYPSGAEVKKVLREVSKWVG